MAERSLRLLVAVAIPAVTAEADAVERATNLHGFQTLFELDDLEAPLEFVVRLLHILDKLKCEEMMILAPSCCHEPGLGLQLLLAIAVLAVATHAYG